MLSTLLKRTAKDIAIYFPGKFLPALTSLITVPIFTRLFKPEEYGVLAVIGVFTAVGGIAVGNWLTSSVMRFLPYYKRRQKLDQFYSTLLAAFVLALGALAPLGTLVYVVIKNTVSGEVYKLLPLSGLIIATSSLFNIFQTVLRADQRAKLFVTFEWTQVYGSLVVGLCLVILFHFGVEGILWGSFLVVTIVNAIIYLWLKNQGVQVKTREVSISTLRDFVTYGIPAGASTIGTWILSLSDRYLIEYFRGTAEVGLYSIGYNLADKSMNLIVTSLMLAIGPVLINTWESDNRKYTADLLSQYTRLMALLGVPMVTGLVVLSTPLFQVLTTEAYLPGARVLPWVSLGALIYGFSLLAYTGLILAKKTMVIARNYLIAGALNVILNLIFLPHFGFMAAAVNTTVAYFALLILNIFSATKYLPWIFPWRTLINSLLGSSIMGLSIWTGKFYFKPGISFLLLSIFSGAVIYLITVVLMGELTKIEKNFLVNIFNKLISNSD